MSLQGGCCGCDAAAESSTDSSSVVNPGPIVVENIGSGADLVVNPSGDVYQVKSLVSRQFDILENVDTVSLNLNRYFGYTANQFVHPANSSTGYSTFQIPLPPPDPLNPRGLFGFELHVITIHATAGGTSTTDKYSDVDYWIFK